MSENEMTEKRLPYNPEVTDHDLDILEQSNIHGDGGADQVLRDRKVKPDFAGKDLDIPGRNQAKKGDGKGLKDEENQLYSEGEEKEDQERENQDIERDNLL